MVPRLIARHRSVRERNPESGSACGPSSFSLRVHRGRVGDADDRTLAGLQPSNGLSPRLGACVVQQSEALVLQLVGSGLDGVGVGNLELDARLGYRPIIWPLRRAEAGSRSFGQRPDPERLASFDVFAIQVAVTFPGQG